MKDQVVNYLTSNWIKLLNYVLDCILKDFIFLRQS